MWSTRFVSKDAYEKEIAVFEEKNNNIFCHLTRTIDTKNLMVMRYDRVEDDVIGYEAKKLEPLARENSLCRQTLTTVVLVVQMARLNLDDFE